MKKLISLLSIFLMCSCIIFAQNDPQNNANKPKSKVPVIQFEKKIHDFGQMTQGDNGLCEFVFKNIGKEPLIITNVRSSCGCTVPEKPNEPILPGKKSSIKVKYDTRRIGPINKTVTVSSNATEPEIYLQIKGHVSAKPAEQVPSNEKNSPVMVH